MSQNGKICAKCRVELRVKTNDVRPVEMTINGPAHVWAADLWHCPVCGLEVLLGFGESAWSSQGELGEELARLEAGSFKLYRFWINQLERKRYDEQHAPA